MIHDVGKLSVPAEILNKPGPLSDVEFDLIRVHPDNGARHPRRRQVPLPVAEAVYQHHERLDGSGYPRGLAGDEIILEARILAVADVVEAMASHRPYRPALGLEAGDGRDLPATAAYATTRACVDACLAVVTADVSRSTTRRRAPDGRAGPGAPPILSRPQDQRRPPCCGPAARLESCASACSVLGEAVMTVRATSAAGPGVLMIAAVCAAFLLAGCGTSGSGSTGGGAATPASGAGGSGDRSPRPPSPRLRLPRTAPRSNAAWRSRASPTWARPTARRRKRVSGALAFIDSETTRWPFGRTSATISGVSPWPPTAG